MTHAPVEEDAPGLSVPAQTYVALVAVLAGAVHVAGSQAVWTALVLLTLPLSLVAMWVAFYSGLAVGLVTSPLTGAGPAETAWPVLLTWVAVWAATAWVNARLLEKLMRRGWDALRT